jgi:uncharacterized membrane protein
MSPHNGSLLGSRRLILAAGIIGFALGGFIDGILLHQVLQWHHLLSLVEGERFRDLKVQILADGLFHVLMYVIALTGLWLLWCSRREVTGTQADLRTIAAALLGFGIWQIVDVVGFHWLAGIHRIRVDVPNPLAWDIGWLIVFAGPSLSAGWWLMRQTGPGGPAGPLARAAPTALAALTLATGPVWHCLRGASLPRSWSSAQISGLPRRSRQLPKRAEQSSGRARPEMCWRSISAVRVPVNSTGTERSLSVHR